MPNGAAEAARRLSRRELAVLRAQGEDAIEDLLALTVTRAGEVRGGPPQTGAVLRLRLAAAMLASGIAYRFVRAAVTEPMAMARLEEALGYWTEYQSTRCLAGTADVTPKLGRLRAWLLTSRRSGLTGLQGPDARRGRGIGPGARGGRQ